MIQIVNYLLANFIRFISLLILKVVPSLRLQFSMIRIAIGNNKFDLKNIDQNFICSLVLVEDKRFFKHCGIDIYAIFRACIKNIYSSRLEGASTISQQLVRILTNERCLSIKRKLKEIMFATMLNGEFNKETILSAYLSLYAFRNCIGIIAFCILENYDIPSLSTIEIAQIIARFKYPSITGTNYIRYLKRVRIIEKKILMHNKVSIDQIQFSVFNSIENTFVKSDSKILIN
ncbi:MAG TPA: biosynthetic peptidoglycan transglycosylase [Puia sp.]|jgi:membrane carboxypeptidase/penicillin-binding protein|nr:biosynthetic peptidoglycan transglycosylase [Puia sp.]